MVSSMHCLFQYALVTDKSFHSYFLCAFCYLLYSFHVLNMSIRLRYISSSSFCVQHFFIEIYITEAKMTVLVLDGSEEGVGIRRLELNRVRIIFFCLCYLNN